MGLEDFLIPREPSPSESIPSLGDIEGLVATPPLDPEMDPEPAAPPGSAPTTTRPPMPIQARPRDAERVDRAIESSAELAAGVIIAPPAAEAPGMTSGSADPIPDRPNAREASYGRPFAASPEIAGKLESFLATAVEPSVPHPGRIDRIESEFISTVPLAEPGLAADIPMSPRSAIRTPRFGESPIHPVERPFRRSDRDLTPPHSEGVFNDATVDGPSEDGFGRIEGRLSRVADRLERAAERFAAPAPSPGSRPRPFRGRIDG